MPISQPTYFDRRHVNYVLSVCVWLASVAAATEPPVAAVAFSPNGKTVVAASQAGLREFGWPQLELKRTIRVAAANLHCVAFSPDGQSLAVGGGNPSQLGVVECFSWPDARVVSTHQQHSDSVRSLAWIDSDQFVSGGHDRELRLSGSQQKSGSIRQTFSGHSRGVSSVLILKDGQTMVSAGDDQSLRVWDLNSSKLVRSMNQHTQPIHSLAIRPNVSGLPMVASAAGDRTIRFWQPTIGRMVRYIRLDSIPLAIAWLDQNRIAAACVDGRVKIIDVNDVMLLDDLAGIEGWAYAISVHPTDGSMIVAGNDGQIQRIELPETGVVE